METIFNFFRWLLPFLACISIPMIPALVEEENEGDAMQGTLHGVVAVVGFFGALILELVASFLQLVRFFGTAPLGYYYRICGRVRWLWVFLLSLRILAIVWGFVCA